MSICSIPWGILYNSTAINRDIIQGSKLAPTFFDIYSNDMHLVLAGNEFVMYADITAVVYVGDDLAELVNNVNFMLEKLVNWCRFNKMALNPTKCEFMLLTNKHILNKPIIKLSGQFLKSQQI